MNEAEAAAVSPSRLLWPEGEEEARSASPEEKRKKRKKEKDEKDHKAEKKAKKLEKEERARRKENKMREKFRQELKAAKAAKTNRPSNTKGGSGPKKSSPKKAGRPPRKAKTDLEEASRGVAPSAGDRWRPGRRRWKASIAKKWPAFWSEEDPCPAPEGSASPTSQEPAKVEMEVAASGATKAPEKEPPTEAAAVAATAEEAVA